MGFASRHPRQLGTLLSGLVTGMLVHTVAGMVFAAIVLLNMEGCDPHDGRVGTLTTAVTVDVLLTGPLLWIVLRANRQGWLAVLAGWAISIVPALVLLAAAAVHASSLPTGCPV
ncbi:hypothetical protein GA0074696_3839 [Micromonospora purpureochromogenes]|uniref:Uncharacterized protein n=1 Tax=Micromonospora purpureochromogenes TaxID=47872 RepID=A0A1C4YYE7_9ACTN|nr:hypothetical protein [Micromonospora purpureochromogenes]SCF25720.1 hypothetical protein GA0074696_3839 [Micromonospora purpureochromogenes]